jgi:small nuclear ribonucleoprotein (snRNP)-like protein
MSTTISATTHKKYNNKTLGSLLRYWEGMEVAVELKTGKIYRGTLASAEKDMTVTLERAASVMATATAMIHPTTNTIDKSTRVGEHEQILLLSMLQIRGSQIRYIHFIEPKLDLSLVVKQGMERERAASQKYKRGTRK